MPSRWIMLPLVLILLAPFAGPGLAEDPDAAGAGPASGSTANGDDFPEFPAIRDHVAFWTRVFGEWSLGQAAVHDLDHPSLIYEVVDLPGPIEDRYTEEQVEFTEDLIERWGDRLRRLSTKAAAGDPLDADERALAERITAVAGPDGLRDADERLRTQRGLRERFRRGLEIAGRYEPRIRAIFHDAGLPEDLAFLPHVESSFQATARSSAGAVGVWQFTRGTGRLFLRIDRAVDERLDPVAAARGAAAYLREAYAELGSWPLALTSYNHGLVGMMRAAEKLGADYEKIFREYDGRSFGFASKNFYAEFLAARNIARDPQGFFPEGLKCEPALDDDELVLDRRTTPGYLARRFGIAPDELAARNPAWTDRAVERGLPLPPGLGVWLPAGTLAGTRGLDKAPPGCGGQLDRDGQYVVRPGDALSAIADAYGVELDSLRAYNGIDAVDSLIRPGQRLRLTPPPPEAVHVVRRGETLSGIAARYGMEIDDVRRLNGISRGASLIRVGERLRMHGDSGNDVYRVRRGDTLLGIALRHGVRLSSLLASNGLSIDSTIRPGQRLRIPDKG